MTLREEHRLRVLENRIMKIIFGAETETSSLPLLGQTVYVLHGNGDRI
jgi:hypothetical protein